MRVDTPELEKTELFHSSILAHFTVYLRMLFTFGGRQL